MVVNKNSSELIIASNSAEGTDRNVHSQSSPERGIFEYFKLCCLWVWLPINLNLGANRDLALWDTDNSWHTLNYWEPTNNKAGYLDNHKSLRDNQGLGQHWTRSFISYTGPLPEDWARWLFYLVLKNLHRVKENETEGYVPNEEQAKTSEKKKTYEMRCYLPNEVKNNTHKDAH